MQFQSDIVNTKVIRPTMVETTALGAAYLAGLAVGFWKDVEELKSKWKVDQVFAPLMDDAQRMQKIKDDLEMLLPDIKSAISDLDSEFE
jgi:glycerol kinase